jgi:hypothetical protein
VCNVAYATYGMVSVLSFEKKEWECTYSVTETSASVTPVGTLKRPFKDFCTFAFIIQFRINMELSRKQGVCCYFGREMCKFFI